MSSTWVTRANRALSLAGAAALAIATACSSDSPTIARSDETIGICHSADPINPVKVVPVKDLATYKAQGDYVTQLSRRSGHDPRRRQHSLYTHHRRARRRAGTAAEAVGNDDGHLPDHDCRGFRYLSG